MTKEEAIVIIDSLNPGVIIKTTASDEKIKEAIKMALIALSQPSLPSDLDEAANNYGIDIRLSYPRVMDETDKYIFNAFKAGAEWMAGQGETKRGVATQDHFIQFADDTYIDLDPTMKLIPAFKIKDAEEIVVQIRKR